jgi:hypothetical protein
MSCKSNPDKITHKHSDKAGAQKGSTPWNAGKTFPNKVLDRIVQVIENNELSKYSEPAARRTAKAYLIHTNGNKCSICGTTDWFGVPVPLVCDHISGDSTDNRIENFRLVCCNCDALLPTFKSKNRGKGRAYDRDYRQLKSNKK